MNLKTHVRYQSVYVNCTADDTLQRCAIYAPHSQAPTSVSTLQIQWRAVRTSLPEGMSRRRPKETPNLRDQGLNAWNRIQRRPRRHLLSHPTKKTDRPRPMRLDRIMAKERICRLLRCPHQARRPKTRRDPAKNENSGNAMQSTQVKRLMKESWLKWGTDGFTTQIKAWMRGAQCARISGTYLEN